MTEISQTLRVMATQVPYIELGGFDLKQFAENLIKAAERIKDLELSVKMSKSALVVQARKIEQLREQKRSIIQQLEQQIKNLEAEIKEKQKRIEWLESRLPIDNQRNHYRGESIF